MAFKNSSIKMMAVVLVVSIFLCGCNRELAPQTSTPLASASAPAPVSSTPQSCQTEPQPTRLELTPQCALLFENDIRELTDFSGPDGREIRPSVIHLDGDDLYYLSYNGYYVLNRQNLDTGEKEVMYTSYDEDINTFLRVNDNEWVFFFQREHALGYPQYKTEAFYYNRQTQELVSFAEKYGLGEVPSDGIADFSYYDGYFYFSVSYDENGKNSKMYRVNLVTGEQEKVNLFTNYMVDSGNIYDGKGALFMTNPETLDEKKIIQAEGEKGYWLGKNYWLGKDNFYVSRNTLRLLTYEDEAAVVAFTIDMAEEQIVQAVTMENIEGPAGFKSTGSYIPVQDGYFYELQLYAENIIEPMPNEQFMQLICYDLEGNITASFPAINLLQRNWHIPQYIVVHNTLYFLEHQYNDVNKTTSLQLASVQSTI